MTFLDTVDGKLARVTLRSSRLGHVLDHGIDLVHPPIWWLAFGASLLATGPAWVEAATVVTVGGYLVSRLLEGIFLAVFGFEIHSWRPVDSAFRLVTARRNPNLVLLSAGALAGRPDLGLAAVALWSAASVAFHALRLVMAFAARRQGLLLGWQERAAVGSAAAPGSGSPA
jgi:phosphatidylglycerophosphate synthase